VPSAALCQWSQAFSASITGGGLRGPPFLFLDARQQAHTGLEAKLANMITPTLADMGFELVRVAVSGRERLTIQVMADRADGALLTLSDCEALSRALGAVLDVEDPIAGAWNLEVSSAGIDRPLTRPKDWNRFSGHIARAELINPVQGRKRFTGVVLGADAKHARLRLEDGTEVALPLSELRRARLVLTDALIAATSDPPRAN
jgi:ribosome maturation factor RimP